MNYISDVKHSNNETSFSLNNINNSLANALRRIVISEFKTVGFRYHESSSDIQILKNTTKYHNEYLSHRISMIPLHGTNPDTFDIDKYKFVINKKNTSDNVLAITSNDFDVYEKDEQGNWKLDNEKKNLFFRPNNVSNDYILITFLKENNIENGQEIHLECKPSISNGLENIHYSPVCKCVLFNRVSDSIYQENLEKLLDGKTPHEIERITKNFMYLDGERCYEKDENGEPFEFTFSMENIETLSNYDIFLGSLKILTEKIQNFNSNIQENNLKIDFSKLTEFRAVDIIIPGETHTLGNLMQSYLYKYFMLEQQKLSFVGFDKSHPLDEHIIMRISISGESQELSDYINVIKEVVEETCDNLINILKVMEKEWKLKYKTKKISLKKK